MVRNFQTDTPFFKLFQAFFADFEGHSNPFRNIIKLYAHWPVRRDSNTTQTRDNNTEVLDESAPGSCPCRIFRV